MVFVVIALLVVVAGFYISRQPDEFKVTRSCVIHAPAPVVFEYVNDLQKWQEWSPWARLDPNAKSIFSGPVAGVGASLRWEGNNKVGVGTMTIKESVPAQRVQFQLDFEKPMKATNQAYFVFTSSGQDTNVSWTMEGRSNFIGKLMSLVFNCEKMVGGQFEQGFANLNQVIAART